MKYDILAIGASAGGVHALMKIFTKFRQADKVAIVIILHLSSNSKSYMNEIISRIAKIEVYEIEDKMEIRRGVIFIAPPNYHVLIEKDGTFTLTTTEKICFARPSIDVTFESVADAFGESAIGLLLTGANHDGGHGLELIHAEGGYTMVQNPTTSESRAMPEYAIKHFNPNEIVELGQIGIRLNEILKNNGENR